MKASMTQECREFAIHDLPAPRKRHDEGPLVKMAQEMINCGMHVKALQGAVARLRRMHLANVDEKEVVPKPAPKRIPKKKQEQR